MAWMGPIGDQIQRLTLLVLAMGVFAGCEMIKPATERPQPKDQVFAKSFFFQPDGKTSKTFLCGEASINESGQIAKRYTIHNHNREFACNVQFKITETHLIGRQIDPSYPNDPDGEWEDYIVIPIKAHFYQERKKDGRGRETNEIIRNTERSHWSARPYFELDLNNVSMGGAVSEGYASFLQALFQTNQYVQDIEVDAENGFFGFSVVKTARTGGESTQAVIRYNLLEMHREPGFQVTPWVSENEVFLNPIFNVGARVQGRTNVFSLGKWRLREDRPILLVLNGWPSHLEHIAYDVIREWNEVLTRVMKPGHQGEPISYFQITDEKPRFQFDLRYSALNYIADPEISAYSPLGIAMVNPDVVTGEILWGAANVYGGLLENLVNTYSSSKAASMMAGAVPPNIAYYDPSANIDLDSGLKRLAQLQSPRVLSNVNPFISEVLLDPSSWAVGAVPMVSETETTNPLDPTGKLTESFRTRVLADLNAVDAWMMRQADLSGVTSKRDLLGLGSLHSIEELEMNYSGFSQLPDQQKWSLLYKVASQEASQMAWGGSVPSDLEAAVSLLNDSKAVRPSDFTFEETLRQNYSGLRTYFDTERNVLNYMAGNTTILDYKPREEALKVLIKEVVSHEFGHFLGLGHNFKENILPDPAKTDPEVYQKLVSKIDVERGRFANATTIMGYPDMRTVMQWSYEDAAPGPHDEQALNYIYANKYPVWDAGENKVVYRKVPEGGLIPRQNAFLPQCDDFTASYGIDPLCQRWDRGHNAESIVRNYFKDLDESLFHSLVAFTDSMSGSGWARQNSLWYKAFTVLGRVRLFYDHMRLEYRSVFEQALEGRQAENVLFEFAEACRDEKFSEVWTPIFAEHPGLKELCVVNYIALDEMQKLLSTEGPDFTKYDVRESYVTYSFNGVAYDGSRVNGRMTRLTALPVKYASLMMATSSVPYMLYGPYLIPRFHLNNSEARFAYHTLYPLKITQMMSSNVEANLKFENKGDNSKTVIGRSVLAMSALLRNTRQSNDPLWVSDDDFLDKLYSHTRFSNINYVAVLMRKSPREDDKFRVTHFDSKLYNFGTGATQELNQDVYLLDDLSVIVRSPQRMLLMPVTKFRWLDNNQGYVVAISTEYEDDINNQLLAHSVAGKLTSLVKDQFTSCVQGPAGQDNGLAFFFNSAVEKSVFPGFEVYDGIATNEEHQNTFKISVRDNFERYWNWTGETGESLPPEPRTCRDAARGMAVGFITAEAINGYWLSRILDYIEKE